LAALVDLGLVGVDLILRQLDQLGQLDKALLVVGQAITFLEAAAELANRAALELVTEMQEAQEFL
jgi:hypothetical protein